MKLSKNSMYAKFLALLRYFLIRIYYPKKLKIKKISYIGSGIRLIISKHGSIDVKGKIKLHDNVELQAKGKIIIGDRCSINPFSRIIAFDEIVLGDRVIIAQYVSILDHDHGANIIDGKLDLDNYVSKPIKIGNNVWIGDKVTITKGVIIGDNVIVAANAVITKDIPSNSIYGGIPGKKIRELI